MKISSRKSAVISPLWAAELGRLGLKLHIKGTPYVAGDYTYSHDLDMIWVYGPFSRWGAISMYVIQSGGDTLKWAIDAIMNPGNQKPRP